MSIEGAAASNADFYWENGCLVFTASYLLRRGACCGSGCRHCPYRQKRLDRKEGLPNAEKGLAAGATKSIG